MKLLNCPICGEKLLKQITFIEKELNKEIPLYEENITRNKGKWKRTLKIKGKSKTYTKRYITYFCKKCHCGFPFNTLIQLKEKPMNKYDSVGITPFENK